MKKIVGCCAFVVILVNLGYSSGQPGEYKTSNRYRALGIESSPLVNPSFIIEKAYPSAQYILSSFLGEFYYHDVRLTTPLTPKHSLGLTWLNCGPRPYDLIEEAGSEAVGKVVDQKNLLTLTYGSNILNPFQFGVNVNVLHERLFDETNSSFGVDAGISFNFSKTIVGTHVLGCAVHNAVAPTIGTQYPRVLAASWHGVPFDGPVFAGIDVQLKDIMPDPAEYSSFDQREWELNSKLGFTLFNFVKFTGLAGFSRTGLEYIGIAAGMNGFSLNKEREIQAAVQHLRIADGMDLQSLHIQGEFGRDRLDAYREHMKRLQQQAPLQLLEKGLRLYNKKKYWEAFMVFGEIRAFHPEFKNMDKVLAYAGSSLERMDMNSEAKKLYTKGKKSYPNSDFQVDFALGLLRIHYRERSGKNLKNVYEEVLEMAAPDSIRQHAHYLMGEMYLQRNNFGIAQQFFKDVPAGHPDYPFALYSDAMASYHIRKYSDAIAKLENLVTLNPTTNAQNEIINRANLQIATLYMEELWNEPDAALKAEDALKRVQENSIYYPEALMQLSWLSVRNRKWNESSDFGYKLFSMEVHHILKCEGALTAALGYYRGKDYKRAIYLLDQGISMLEKKKNAKKEKSLTFREINQRIDGIGKKLGPLASRKGVDGKAEKKLSRKYQEMKKLADEQFRELNENRLDDLAKTRSEELLSDMYFLIADATRRVHGDNTDRKVEKIDKQIEELQKKMEKSE